MPLLEVTQSFPKGQCNHSPRRYDRYPARPGIRFRHSSVLLLQTIVIEHALAYVFSKDRELQDYLKSPQASSVSPSLRVRKPARAAKSSEAPKGTPVPASTPTNGARSVEARA